MIPTIQTSHLVENLKSLIESSRDRLAKIVNQEMTVLYWNIGKMIHQDILKSERAEYGKQIISTVSKELNALYGQGFSAPNISRMITLYQDFPDFEVISTLSTKLTWSHFVEILPIQDPLKRNF